MSKIHEALRKAHEERLQNAPPEALLVDTVPAETLHSEAPTKVTSRIEPAPRIAPSVAQSFVVPVVERRQPNPPSQARGNAKQFTRFEDLLAQCAKPAWQIDSNAVVFSNSRAPFLGAEQFRTLRTRLYQMREAAPLKKILVTSAMTAEGKTFVATNLAQAIACERDRKVLLIDGDLRSARLHLPLGAPLTPGLSEYLGGQASETEIVQHGSEGNLCFIAAGDGGNNPSELLSNGKIEKLLDRLAPLFDWVILDSPPCLPVADAGLLAGIVDGVLLVVRAKSTTSANAQRARQELQKRNVIGVVLNAVKDSDSYGGAYSQGYGYGYGNREQKKPVRQ
jgi:protein-tyrosine kinase